jgi:hypothetical protein
MCQINYLPCQSFPSFICSLFPAMCQFLSQSRFLTFSVTLPKSFFHHFTFNTEHNTCYPFYNIFVESSQSLSSVFSLHLFAFFIFHQSWLCFSFSFSALVIFLILFLLLLVTLHSLSSSFSFQFLFSSSVSKFLFLQSLATHYISTLNSSSIPHYSFFSNTWFLFLQLFLFILFFV